MQLVRISLLPVNKLIIVINSSSGMLAVKHECFNVQGHVSDKRYIILDLFGIEKGVVTHSSVEKTALIIMTGQEPA